MKTNQEILEEIDKIVYGHEKAKKVLINTINRNKLRYEQHFRDLKELDDCVPKANCLLISESGTGKTYLINSLCKLMNIPIIKFDASHFNPVANKSGYSVKDIKKSIIEKVTEIYENNRDKYFSVEGVLMQSIVFIDEFDKMCIKTGDEGWGRKTQSEFLTLFEMPMVTFVFAGAFTDYIKREMNNKQSIGFFNESKIYQENNIEEDILKFGTMPELLGRINNIILLDKLEKSTYYDILNNIILPKYNKLMSHLSHSYITLTNEQKDNIINKAFNSKMGIRALNKELENISLEYEFNCNL